MPSGTHIDSFPGDVKVTGSLVTGNGVNSVFLEEGSGSTYKRLLIADATSGALQFKTHGSVEYSPQNQYLNSHAQSAVHSVQSTSSQTSSLTQVSSTVGFANYVNQATYAPYAQGANHAAWAYSTNFAPYSGYSNHAQYAVYANFAGTGGYAQNSNPHYGAIYANNWFRAQGHAGFYFESYHGGWQMTDHTWVRASHNKMVIAFGGQQFWGNEAYIDFADHEHDWWQNWGSIVADTGAKQYTLYCEHAIRAQSYSATSDRRIKKNIEDLDDVEALETVRALKPCKYDYKANYKKTQKKQIGFIAQEVQEVLPDAIHLVRDSLPNIQSKATVSLGNYDELSGVQNFIVQLDNEPTEVVVSVGDTLHVAVPGNQEMYANVVGKSNSTVYELTFSYDHQEYLANLNSESDAVFVLGTYVDDFHVLDKAKIWAVSVAALQQIDREHKSQKNEMINIESDIDSILSRVQALEDAVV